MLRFHSFGVTRMDEIRNENKRRTAWLEQLGDKVGNILKGHSKQEDRAPQSA